MVHRRRIAWIPGCLFMFSFLLSQFPGLTSAAVVTLDSIEIFRTHEWLPFQPKVYFQCKGENQTQLPDVKEKHVVYTFKGVESWQPLTELMDVKCKRCGFYEEDTISDHLFDEWEFCASDFSRLDGKYIHLKDKELNATFLCPKCAALGSASDNSSKPEKHSNGMHWALILAISVVISSVLIIGLVTALKYWQKKKKEQEQARFLRLFEETDDAEYELGIGPLSDVV